MQTVKCSKCGAEQEIYLNDQSKAVCVFCGEEITDLPEGFVPPAPKETEGAEPLPEVQEVPRFIGSEITAEYTLSYDDVKCGLYETGRVSRKRTSAIVETVLIALFFGMQVYNIIELGFKSITTAQIFMMVIMAALIPFVWLTPVLYERKYIKSIADGTRLTARIYENALTVEVEGAEKPTEVALDKTSVFFDSEKRFFLVIPNGSVIILPKASFAAEDIPKVERRLKEGTLESLPENTNKK